MHEVSTVAPKMPFIALKTIKTRHTGNWSRPISLPVNKWAIACQHNLQEMLTSFLTDKTKV